MATPKHVQTRAARATVALLDRALGKIAWPGELRVSGQGSASISDKAFIPAATNELTSKLKSADLIVP